MTLIIFTVLWYHHHYLFLKLFITSNRNFVSIKQWLPIIPFPQTLSSVQFSCLAVSDSLRPHGPQPARPPCPSPAPGVYPNSCALSWWCHPTIPSSVIPFFSCPQSFPASGSFQMSLLFASGGQSIGVSASTSVPPMNTQDRSPLGRWKVHSTRLGN